MDGGGGVRRDEMKLCAEVADASGTVFQGFQAAQAGLAGRGHDTRSFGYEDGRWGPAIGKRRR